MCNLSDMFYFVAKLILAASFVNFRSLADVCHSNTGNPPQYDFYPNVTDRSSFIQCLNVSGIYTNVSQTCPDGFVFRAKTSRDDDSPLCVSNLSRYGQASFDCSTNQNGNGSYSEDKTLYVTCSNGAPKELHQCPMGEYFLESMQRCNLTCAVRYRIGSFALSEASKYYSCAFNYGTLMWILTVHTCPTNQSFNQKYQTCLRTSPTSP